MPVEITEISTKKEIKEFVKFQLELYKDSKHYIPPIITEEMEIFDRKKNPAYEDGDSKLFIAKENGKIIGRIAGVLSNPLNRKWKTKNLRFGWIEMINRQDVTKALLDAVENWAKELGMETVTGPHGFCDFDPQGLLVEGFDRAATIASYYHLPYYQQLVESCGYSKDVDYIEFWSTVPKDGKVPQKMIDTANWVKKRYNYKLLDYKKPAQYKARADEIFALLEESFEDNYGTSPLSKKQVDYYVKKYISYIHKDLIKVVVNEKDEMIGFLITMPSLTKAYQKANGKLFPFGVFHLLKAIKTYNVLDFYFSGVKKEYRSKGIDLIMAVEIVQTAINLGFKHAESNQELEHNSKIQAEWKFFNPVQHKRRRIYKKIL